jgi:hypothetical protein
MEANTATVEEARAAIEDERYDDALQILKSLFNCEASNGSKIGGRYFITMFEWSLLVDDYAPAVDALASVRDEQLRLLLEGDYIFGDRNEPWPRSRFQVIAGMNDMLKDSRSTYEMFIHLMSSDPAQARKEAFRAMPAVVEAGDFVLAERYIDDPLARIDEINQLARDLPLFPPAPGWTPRVAGELSNFIKFVMLRSIALRGLGRDVEAQALRDAALSGLASDEIRALAQREMDAPGAINRELTERRMSIDA